MIRFFKNTMNEISGKLREIINLQAQTVNAVAEIKTEKGLVPKEITESIDSLRESVDTMVQHVSAMNDALVTFIELHMETVKRVNRILKIEGDTKDLELNEAITREKPTEDDMRF